MTSLKLDKKNKSKPDEIILDIKSLSKWFPINNSWNRRTGWLKALDDISLSVNKGEIIGVVGESGCGKSTLGKTVMGIHTLTKGSINFEGSEVGLLKPSESRQLRRRLQYTYQDPGSSLDPRWKIGTSLHEPLEIHTKLNKRERTERVRQILAAVNLPEAHLDLYPHEISGGQQRRVGLARILTLHPSLVILDEPTSGLDVSVQATILNLFLDLKKEFNLTYVFISHDLSVVRMICDRVAVMYLGKIIEINETEKLFSNPQHPYTQSLLSAIPVIGGQKVTENFSLEGEPPDPSKLPTGCRFRTRCPKQTLQCEQESPPLLNTSSEHAVACYHPST
ncbi:MAG: oligopeptide transport system ATP-binding protein [Paracoccaceae bacterium]|jgi:oligopeptide transport system ATP-binding protein